MSKKYYRLKDGFVLRGWDKLPYAVVEWHTKKPSFLDEKSMRALELCDGEHNVDSPFVTEAQRKEIAQFLERGWITPCSEGDRLADIQRYLLYPARYVQTVQWAVTGRCNFRCRHCMMSAPDAALGELSHKSALDIVDQLAECGVLQVALTGGDPFVRRDYPELIDALVKKGINIVQIYTNGALLDHNVIDYLASLKQRPDIIISFDGVGHHDWLRGVNGAEQMADRAFTICHEKGLPTFAQVTLHRGNISSLRRTILHLGELGCRAVRVSPATPAGNWVEYNDSLSLTIEELFEVFLGYIPHYYEDGMPVPLTLAGLVELSPKNPNFYGLPFWRGGKGTTDDQFLLACSRKMLLITADGKPNICELTHRLEERSAINVDPIVSDDPEQKTTPLRDVLSADSAFMEVFSLRAHNLTDAGGPCSACEFFEACVGGCRASAVHETGEILDADPKSCLVYKGGWAKRLLKLMATYLSGQVFFNLPLFMCVFPADRGCVLRDYVNKLLRCW